MQIRALPRRRLAHLTIAAPLTLLLSLPGFQALNHDSTLFPELFRNPILLVLLLAIPPTLVSLVLTFLLHRTLPPDLTRLTSLHQKPLLLIALSAAFASLAQLMVLAVQIAWVVVASQAGVIWLLALLAIGLVALSFVVGSLLMLCISALRLKYSGGAGGEDRPDVPTSRTAAKSPNDTVLQIGPDSVSPQNVFMKIPGSSSSLTF